MAHAGPYNGMPVSLSSASCLTNGEASLALKQAQGDWVTSMVGYTLSYNTLDNPRDPHSGRSCRPEAGFRRPRRLFGLPAHDGRSARLSRALFRRCRRHRPSPGRRCLPDSAATRCSITDNFNLGPSLVRGFAPGGMGPRDITNVIYGNNNGNALGGTDYCGRLGRNPVPDLGPAQGHRPEGRAVLRRRHLWNYTGATNFTAISPGFNYAAAGVTPATA